MEVIPDVPEHIAIQLERTEFIRRKLIDRVADDNEADEVGVDRVLEIKEYPDFGGVYAHEVAAIDTEHVQVYKWRSL
jgi:hypothetical protein